MLVRGSNKIDRRVWTEELAGLQRRDTGLDERHGGRGEFEDGGARLVCSFYKVDAE